MSIAGTDRGSNANNTGATSLVITPASNFNAGSKAVLCVSYDNAGTSGADPYSSITDSLGNTWTPRQNSLIDPGAANAGCASRIFDSDMTVGTLTTGNTITVSFGATSVTAKAWTLMEITPDSGYVITYVTGGQATQTSASPSITTGSITSGGMLIGMIGREGNSTRTDDADTTNGSWSTAQKTGVGTTTGGQEIITQRKVVTATGTQTYNPTFSASADGCNLWVWYTEDLAKTPAQVATAFTGQAPTIARTQNVLSLPAQADLALALPMPTFIIPPAGGFLSAVLLEVGGVGLPVATVSQPANGALSLAGLAPAAIQSAVTFPGVGAAAFAGLAPVSIQGGQYFPAQGTIAFAGLAPAVVLENIRLPSVGAATFTGLTPVALRGGSPIPGTAVLTLAGLAPNAIRESIYLPSVGTAAFGGLAPTVRRDAVAQPGVASLQASGQTPAGVTSGNYIAQPGQGAAALTGLAPVAQVSASVTVAPGVGTFAFTGRAPSNDRAVLVGRAALALTPPQHQAPVDFIIGVPNVALVVGGQAPSIAFNIIPSVGAAALTGLTPTVISQAPAGFLSLAMLEAGGVGIPSTSVVATPGVGTLVLQGPAPSAFTGPEGAFFSIASLMGGNIGSPPLSFTVLPGVATAAFTGLAPQINVSITTFPGVGTLSFTGLAPSLLSNRIVAPGAVALAFSGQAPIANFSFACFPAVGTLALQGLAPDARVEEPAVAPPTDHSLPMAWFVDPGYITLFFTFPTFPVSPAQATQPDVAPLLLEGLLPVMVVDFRKDIGVGTLALQGLTPLALVTASKVVFPAQGTISAEGLAPVVNEVRTSLPGVAAVAFAGYAPTASPGYVMYPNPAAASFAGLAPAPVLTQHVTFVPAEAPLNLSGQAPDAVIGEMRVISPDAAVVALEGKAPGVLISALHLVTPDVAVVAAAGQAPSLGSSDVKVPGAVNLGVVGYGPQIIVTGNVIASPGPAVVQAAGLDPAVLLNQIYVSVDNADGEFEGYPPKVKIKHKVHGQLGSGRLGHDRDSSSRRPSASTPRRRPS